MDVDSLVGAPIIPPLEIAPEIYRLSIRKNRTVHAALQENCWIQDINLQGVAPDGLAHQFLRLWEKVHQITLDPSASDEITWKQSSKAEYSAKSVYALQFLGSTTTEFQSLIWKTSAPPKCKQFAWLAIQNRLWTSDRLQARGCSNQAL